MALEEALQELSERRVAYRAYREQVEEELRQLRIEKLAAEQANIEHLVAKAAAAGGTTGQIKRAYGTKDHRTVADILARRASEIKALRNAEVEKQNDTSWFTFTDDGISVRIGDSEALFTYVYVDDQMMLTTETPMWNDDFTQRNEAVALLDGKTEDDSIEAAKLIRAIREQ